jgi:hypothetical protein
MIIEVSEERIASIYRDFYPEDGRGSLLLNVGDGVTTEKATM